VRNPSTEPVFRDLKGGGKLLTVALGMFCIGGIFVSADSHVVSQDGIVTSGYKLNGIECGVGSFVIANSSNDGNAANMVAKDILDDLSKSSDRWNIEPVIKKTMGAWHSGYTQGNPPSMQFILAGRIGKQSRRLYFCEPPNTVLGKHLNESVVIGVGGQIIDPLLPEVIRGPLHSREALIRAAYLMYRAKKEHVFLKGSDTDVLFIAETSGNIYQLTREEMSKAEAVGPEVDFMLRYCYLGLLGMPRRSDQKDFLKSFKAKYLENRKKVDALEFSSLEGRVEGTGKAS
jgi:hypothetical protein